jgi:hypothetical protein
MAFPFHLPSLQAMAGQPRALVAGLLLGPIAGGSDQEFIQQQTLKAAFICHFLTLTRWPVPRKPLVFGIYGHSRMGEELAAALPKSTGLVTINVVRIKPDALDVGSIDALYIPSTFQEEMPAILKRLGSAPVLTLGDAPHFVAEGGTIGFVTEGNKLRFEINQGVATRNGLQFSAKLLELARSIQR